MKKEGCFQYILNPQAFFCMPPPPPPPPPPHTHTHTHTNTHTNQHQEQQNNGLVHNEWLLFCHCLQTQNFRREFIRRAKAWRDLKWPRNTSGMGRPKTYLLSVLVLYAYDSAQKRLGVFSSLSPETMAWQ